MAGFGGGTTINFEDTSQYMFRNSSTQRGGFEGHVGAQYVDTDIDIEGTEDINRTQELLTEDDRDRIRATLAQLDAVSAAQIAGDRTDMTAKAALAWDRAISLWPDTKALIDQEVGDLKDEMLQYIFLWESQWARTAGSSLNCLVQGMRVKATTELTRRLAGIIAERTTRFKEHETQAIAQAFQDNLNARMEPAKVAFQQIANLYGVLRGAHTIDATDRDYTESRDEDVLRIDLLGKFYHEGIDVSDNDGAYGLADSAVSASQTVSQSTQPVTPPTGG